MMSSEASIYLLSIDIQNRIVSAAKGSIFFDRPISLIMPNFCS